MDSNPKKRIRPHHYRTGQMTLLRRHFELTRLALCGVQCPSTIHVASASAAPRTAFRNTLSLKLCLLSSACHFIHSCFHFRPLSGREHLRLTRTSRIMIPIGVTADEIQRSGRAGSQPRFSEPVLGPRLSPGSARPLNYPRLYFSF